MVEAPTQEQARAIAERLAGRDGRGVAARRVGSAPCAGSSATSAPQQARGRRHRRAAAAGVPGLRLRRRRGARRPPGRPRSSAGRQARQPRGGARRPRRCPAPLGIGHTRWATHGRADRPQRPPARRLHRRRRRRAQRHDRELRRAARTGSRARGHELASDTDTEAVAHLVEERYADGGTWPPPSAPWRATSRARSCSSSPTGDAPGPGRRRPAQPAAGRRARRGGELPRQRRDRLHRPHPRGAGARPGPGRRAAPRRRAGHRPRRRRRSTASGSTSTGTPTPPRRAATTTSCSRRSRSSRRPCPRDDRRPARARRPAARSTSWRSATRTSAAFDKVFIVACGSSYHSGLVGKYAIERWCRLPVEVEIASEFRYRDPVLDRAHARHRHLAERRDRRHARGAPARRGQQRAWVLAVTNTVGSTIARESDAALLHPRRAGDRGRLDQGRDDAARRDVPRRALPRPGPRHARRRTRCARTCATSQEIPDLIDRGRSARMDPVRELAREISRRGAGAVPRPAHRLPDGARGRAQAQGARLRLRRGLPRRRDQARADRARRGGHAGRRTRHPARAARQARHQRPGDPGPRRPHDRHRRPTARRRDCPTPTT